jgi:hypothetical protein
VQIYITFLLKFVLPLHLPASLKRVSSTHSTIHLFFYCCVCFCLARLKSALGYPGPSILGYLALCFPQRTTLNQLPSNRQNSDMPNVVGHCATSTPCGSRNGHHFAHGEGRSGQKLGGVGAPRPRY